MNDRMAFIIGARGFIGSNTVRAFLAAGWQVHCYDLPAGKDLLADVRDRIGETIGSVENVNAMSQAMEACGADLIVNFAAFSSGFGGLAKSGEDDADRAMEINVNGLRRSFDAALRAGVTRVLWSSSTTIYGPTGLYPEQPIDEGAEMRPQGIYGLTKAMCEHLSMFYRDQHALETVAVRLPLVFGPGLWYRGAAGALMEMVLSAAPGASHELSGPEAPFDLMYVLDCADALVAISTCEKMLPERLNINGFTTTYPELARAAEAAVPGFKVIYRAQPAPVVYPLISTRLLETTVGFRPRYGVAEAVGHVIEHRGKTHA